MQIGTAGRNLGDVATIKYKMTLLLKSSSEAEFHRSSKQWKEWDKFIVSNGKYFEGEQIDVSQNF
jgi:hypothetical protein